MPQCSPSHTQVTAHKSDFAKSTSLTLQKVGTNTAYNGKEEMSRFVGSVLEVNCEESSVQSSVFQGHDKPPALHLTVKMLDLCPRILQKLQWKK